MWNLFITIALVIGAFYDAYHDPDVWTLLWAFGAGFSFNNLLDDLFR